jgi:hypothetical protein
MEASVALILKVAYMLRILRTVPEIVEPQVFHLWKNEEDIESSSIFMGMQWAS